jgi:hypothetical protein
MDTKNERLIIQKHKKSEGEKQIKDELEKVEIATILCNNCTVEQMRYLRSHMSILQKRLRT